MLKKLSLLAFIVLLSTACTKESSKDYSKVDHIPTQFNGIKLNGPIPESLVDRFHEGSNKGKINGTLYVSNNDTPSNSSSVFGITIHTFSAFVTEDGVASIDFFPDHPNKYTGDVLSPKMLKRFGDPDTVRIYTITRNGKTTETAYYIWREGKTLLMCNPNSGIFAIKTKRLDDSATELFLSSSQDAKVRSISYKEYLHEERIKKDGL